MSSSMLYSFYLRLRPLAPAHIEASQGQHAHALLLGLIHRSSPSLAKAIHDLPGVKPFTVSPLFGRFEGRASALLGLLPEETYSIRVTALNADVFTAVLDGALKTAEQPLRLEQAAFQLVQVQDVPGDAPLVRCQSYEELLETAPLEPGLRLHFMSPATFRTKEARNLLHPDPRLLLQSWLAKWNAFSSVSVDTALIQHASALRPSFANVRVRSMLMGNHPELGFCGDVGYRFAEDLAPEHRRSLTALAEFSLYAGTGAKTTMGMGQSRRIANGHPVPGGARGHAPEVR